MDFLRIRFCAFAIAGTAIHTGSDDPAKGPRWIGLGWARIDPAAILPWCWRKPHRAAT
jgi:hypothetical protein